MTSLICRQCTQSQNSCVGTDVTQGRVVPEVVPRHFQEDPVQCLWTKAYLTSTSGHSIYQWLLFMMMMIVTLHSINLHLLQRRTNILIVNHWWWILQEKIKDMNSLHHLLVLIQLLLLQTQVPQQSSLCWHYEDFCNICTLPFMQFNMQRQMTFKNSIYRFFVFTSVFLRYRLLNMCTSTPFLSLM